MRFWDTSALVPLVIDEPSTAAVAELLADDPEITVWICTSVEPASAVYRRGSSRDHLGLRNAEALIASLESIWVAIDEPREIIDHARRIVMSHRLRALDALQLAAAFVACNGVPHTLPFVTLDRDLATAARAEGFAVLP